MRVEWERNHLFRSVHRLKISYPIFCPPSFPLLSFVVPALCFMSRDSISSLWHRIPFCLNSRLPLPQFCLICQHSSICFSLLQICWNSSSAEDPYLMLEVFYPSLSFEWGSMKWGDKTYSLSSYNLGYLIYCCSVVIPSDVFYLSTDSAISSGVILLFW